MNIGIISIFMFLFQITIFYSMPKWFKEWAEIRPFWACVINFMLSGVILLFGGVAYGVGIGNLIGSTIFTIYFIIASKFKMDGYRKKAFEIIEKEFREYPNKYEILYEVLGNENKNKENTRDVVIFLNNMIRKILLLVF